jgi:hypothetical protein
MGNKIMMCIGGYKMKKLFFGTLFLVLVAFCGMKEASAGWNVNVNIGPPPIVVVAPPAVVFIPDLQVYFVPDLEFDVFFYNGFWWSPRRNGWYRASEYNGPWHGVKKHDIPGPLYRVPKNYRSVYGKEQHIPYGQWKKQGYKGGGNKGGNKGYKSQDNKYKGGGNKGKGNGKK